MFGMPEYFNKMIHSQLTYIYTDRRNKVSVCVYVHRDATLQIQQNSPSFKRANKM